MTTEPVSEEGEAPAGPMVRPGPRGRAAHGDVGPRRDLVRPLPPRDEAPLPVVPGTEQQVGRFRLFVRSTVPDGGATTASAAQPTVFVHGLGGSSTNFTDLMHALVDVLPGVAPDLPGFGRSAPPPDGDYSLLSHSDAVIDLIESLPGPRRAVNLVGNSLGGAVSVTVAARRPDLVRTLTLVSPALPTLWPRKTNVGLPLLLVPGVRAKLGARMDAMSADQRARMVLDIVYADPSVINPERVREAMEDARLQLELEHAGDAFIGSLRDLILHYLLPGGRNLWADTRKVRAPALVFMGAADKLVDVRIAPKIAKRLRDNRVVIFSDLGHVSQMERPRTVARVMADWLDELDYRRVLAR